MKRKQVMALLLSASITASSLTPVLASSIEVPSNVTEMQVLQTQEEVAPSTEKEESPTVPTETPTTPTEVSTTPEETVVPEAQGTATETTKQETVAPILQTEEKKEEPTVKRERLAIGSEFTEVVDNISYTCVVTGENTVNITTFDATHRDYAVNVTIPANIVHNGKSYNIIKVNEIRGKIHECCRILTFSEGIQAFTYDDICRMSLDTINIPSTMKELHMTWTYPDGTKYLSTFKAMSDFKEKWVHHVNIATGNPYLVYKAEENGIFKADEQGPEQEVGATFKKDRLEYKVVEKGVVDVIDVTDLNATALTFPTEVVYQKNTYKVRDCHLENSRTTCQEVTKMTFEEGIRNIYFGDVKNYGGVFAAVETVSYPSTLEKLQIPVFPDLKSISIPETNSRYKAVDGVLYNKDMTKLLHFPSSKAMDKFTVPASVHTIGQDAFVKTRGLKELVIPDTVTTLEVTSVCFTEGVEKITIGKGITSVKQNMDSCTGLKEVVVKMNADYPNSFLWNCPDLEHIYMEGNPQSFGINVFNALPSLKAFHVSNSELFSSEDGVLYAIDGKALVSYPRSKEETLFVVPDRVTNIMSNAFNKVKHLETLVLSKGVFLDWYSINKPQKALDIYVRDTDFVHRDNEYARPFVSQNGGNVYVPNQKVLDSIVRPTTGNVMVDGMQASVKVIPITSLTVEQTELNITKGKTEKLNTTFEPYYATEEIKWTSDNEEVASVDAEGNVTTHSTGSATVTASVAGTSVTVTVNVKAPLESISLNKTEMTLVEGSNGKLDLKINPTDTTDDTTATWDSSNKTVATVDTQGNVVAKGVGTTTITAKIGDKTATCKVTVTRKEVALDYIVITGNTTIVVEGGQVQLALEYYPSDTTVDSKVTWSSSNSEIASVDVSGKVTGHKVGDVIITAEVAGKKATYEMKVTKKSEEVKPGILVEDIFVDINADDWYRDYAQYVYDHKIMTGMDATHFGANANLGRAQLAVIMYRMEGSPKVKFEEKFADVEKGQWYSDAVIWAYQNKIITGYTDTGLFKPANNISRQEMATMLYRYAKFKGYDISSETDIASFPDSGEVSEFAQKPMRWCVGAGIISGDGQTGRLLPYGTTSRAIGATIITRFLKKY